MGRPINPSKIGSGSGKIQVTNYRLTGELEAGAEEGVGAFSVSQRSTRKSGRKNKNKRNQRNVQKPNKGSNQHNRSRPSSNKNFRKPRT